MRLTFILSLFISFSALAQIVQDGNWVQPCNTLGDDAVSASIQVSQSRWQFHHVAYEDSSCATPFFFYDEDLIVTSAPTGTNFQTRRAMMTALSAATADGLNAVSQCGVSNWKPNVAVDVTGKSCGDFQVPAAGTITYTALKVLSLTQFELGAPDDQHDGSSEAQRYTTIETKPFTRQ